MLLGPYNNSIAIIPIKNQFWIKILLKFKSAFYMFHFHFDLNFVCSPFKIDFALWRHREGRHLLKKPLQLKSFMLYLNHLFFRFRDFEIKNCQIAILRHRNFFSQIPSPCSTVFKIKFCNFWKWMYLFLTFWNFWDYNFDLENSNTWYS